MEEECEVGRGRRDELEVRGVVCTARRLGGRARSRSGGSARSWGGLRGRCERRDAFEGSGAEDVGAWFLVGGEGPKRRG